MKIIQRHHIEVFSDTIWVCQFKLTFIDAPLCFTNQNPEYTRHRFIVTISSQSTDSQESFIMITTS